MTGYRKTNWFKQLAFIVWFNNSRRPRTFAQQMLTGCYLNKGLDPLNKYSPRHGVFTSPFFSSVLQCIISCGISNWHCFWSNNFQVQASNNIYGVINWSKYYFANADRLAFILQKGYMCFLLNRKNVILLYTFTFLFIFLRITHSVYIVEGILGSNKYTR